MGVRKRSIFSFEFEIKNSSNGIWFSPISKCTCLDVCEDLGILLWLEDADPPLTAELLHDMVIDFILAVAY